MAPGAVSTRVILCHDLLRHSPRLSICSPLFFKSYKFKCSQCACLMIMITFSFTKHSYFSLRQLNFTKTKTTACIGAGSTLHILFLTSLSFFKLRSVTVYCGDITRGILGGPRSLLSRYRLRLAPTYITSAQLQQPRLTLTGTRSSRPPPKFLRK